MAQMGRPPLGEDKMISISVRLPKRVYEKYKQSGTPSLLMREALDTFLLTAHPREG